MSYRLEANESLADGIRRIALEQVDRAIASLTNSDEDPDEAIHGARKRFKKVRATLRLVRDEIGEEVYKRENVCYRDAGRLLAPVRDSFVKVKTVDDLTAYYSEQLQEDAFAGFRKALQDHYETVSHHTFTEEDAPAQVVDKMEAARPRLETLPIDHNDFSALHDGLRRVYKRGYNRLQDAYEEPVAENFHEWRKRVKYLWYHVRILQPIWPDLLEELADEIHDLSDYLGDDHDLAELRQSARAQTGAFADESEQQALLGLIDQRRAELETAAQPLGKHIYAEEPDAFTSRIEAYWQVWQDGVSGKVRPVYH